MMSRESIRQRPPAWRHGPHRPRFEAPPPAPPRNATGRPIPGRPALLTPCLRLLHPHWPLEPRGVFLVPDFFNTVFRLLEHGAGDFFVVVVLDLGTAAFDFGV